MFCVTIWRTNSFDAEKFSDCLVKGLDDQEISELTFFYQIVQLVSRLCLISLPKRNVFAWMVHERHFHSTRCSRNCPDIDISLLKKRNPLI